MNDSEINWTQRTGAHLPQPLGNIHVYYHNIKAPPLRKLAHAINRDFFSFKIANFQLKNFDIFLIFAKNIDCGYTLELPRRGGSNEYPQSMFRSKNKKNSYTPANPSFTV